MAITSSGVAIVFGATGVSGSALCRQLVRDPIFSTVIGVAHRPLDQPDAQPGIVSGVDLLGELDHVVAMLRGVKDISKVTHVFYAAHRDAPGFDPVEQKRISVTMIRTCVRAIEMLSGKFQVFAMQTSINVYGIFASLQGGSLVCPSPLVESAGRTKSPYREMDAHYAQCDEITRINQGKSWKWFEIRPDAVIGHIPRRHKHNFTISLGLYFSMYAQLHGKGAKVKFPGTPESYNCTFTLVSQDILAKFSTYVATHSGDLKNGEAFNISNDDVLTWSQLWPQLASQFGLVGIGPEEKSSQQCSTSWPFQDKAKVIDWEEKNGLQSGWAEHLSEMCFFNTMLPAVDRVLSLERARLIGFSERDDTVQAFKRAWEIFREAKVMP